MFVAEKRHSLIIEKTGNRIGKIDWHDAKLTRAHIRSVRLLAHSLCSSPSPSVPLKSRCDKYPRFMFRMQTYARHLAVKSTWCTRKEIGVQSAGPLSVSVPSGNAYDRYRLPLVMGHGQGPVPSPGPQPRSFPSVSRLSSKTVNSLGNPQACQALEAPWTNQSSAEIGTHWHREIWIPRVQDHPHTTAKAAIMTA